MMRLREPTGRTNTVAPAGRAGHNLVEVDQVHVAFGHQPVLRDISLRIPRNQTLAIIGESGSGKTVLMKTIIGLIRPSHGVVRFDGMDLSRLNERELAKVRIRFGFVFQLAALFDSMTIGQNVAFPLREHTRFDEKRIREMVFRLLAEVGLPDDVINKRPAELSGGMRKRVGLARALALNPELILYDEPTTGLDPIMSDVINELMIRTSQRDGASSVLVTHDMKSALKVANRIIMVYPLNRLASDEPQIIFDGTPEEVRRATDPRVQQFVAGKAGERLMEMRREMSARKNQA